MKQPYDQKLREAAAEFKAICKKYDCAATALFVSKTHAEFVHALTPSWSVIYFQEEYIRFKSKKEDFESKEAQHEATEATAHILTSIVECSRQTGNTMSSLLSELSKHMRIMWRAWDKPDSISGRWEMTQASDREAADRWCYERGGQDCFWSFNQLNLERSKAFLSGIAHARREMEDPTKVSKYMSEALHFEAEAKRLEGEIKELKESHLGLIKAIEFSGWSIDDARWKDPIKQAREVLKKYGSKE